MVKRHDKLGLAHDKLVRAVAIIDTFCCDNSWGSPGRTAMLREVRGTLQDLLGKPKSAKPTKEVPQETQPKPYSN